MITKTARIQWMPSWRIIADSYPSIKFFERVANPADWEVLIDFSRMTDPSAEDIGDIGLIPLEDRISGPGVGRVIPSFIFLDPNPPGSRFSNSNFGAYYAASELDTAIAEAIYHREQFLKDGGINKPMDIDHLVILADIAGDFHDIRGLQGDLPEVYSLTSYTASQAMAAILREAGSFGILYSSVRRSSGECIAVFRPTVISNIREDIRIVYRWDGTRISGRYRKSDWTII